ncbi:helix-turn-helix domain-containing protein [Dactylosporangium sp. AC04546]|uniref:winged helix-turn-helix transcriptional regulator n=1 Tax=Dactylosporangium sp. AC04546 TaxID=2862460 RepID=UPI001EDCE086|nr:helix-turn-helix domain-containing protein [Dactylosporangium sp. AC04546]WVK81627.1 helix-turn-helix domain-containing protein [Dactylosporangium sp. AC04546]
MTETCQDDELRAVLRGLLTTIGDKWTLAVVATLVQQEQRFTAIQREVEGISHRLLAKTLRDLERDGLVSRTAHAEKPPRVQYALTPLGRTLLDPVDGLIRWVDRHGATVLRNRATAG